MKEAATDSDDDLTLIFIYGSVKLFQHLQNYILGTRLRSDICGLILLKQCLPSQQAEHFSEIEQTLMAPVTK